MSRDRAKRAMLWLADLEAAKADREAAEAEELRVLRAVLGFPQAATWAQIGTIYGMTRQGAQQRFTRLLDAEAAHEPGSGAQRR